MIRSRIAGDQVAWLVCLTGAVTPALVSTFAYMFDDHSLVDFTATNGMSI